MDALSLARYLSYSFLRAITTSSQPRLRSLSPFDTNQTKQPAGIQLAPTRQGSPTLKFPRQRQAFALLVSIHRLLQRHPPSLEAAPRIAEAIVLPRSLGKPDISHRKSSLQDTAGGWASYSFTKRKGHVPSLFVSGVNDTYYLFHCHISKGPCSLKVWTLRLGHCMEGRCDSPLKIFVSSTSICKHRASKEKADEI